MDWYVSRGSAKRGPISDDDIRRFAQAGHLRPTDMVWRSSMPDWKPAGEVAELHVSSNSAVQMPPLPTHLATAQTASGSVNPAPSSSVSNTSYVAAHWQGRLSLATTFWLNVILVGIIFPNVLMLCAGVLMFLSPTLGVIAIIVAGLTYVAMVIWQSVGLYRCAIRHIVAPDVQYKLWAHLSLIYAAQTVWIFVFVAIAIIAGVSALGAETDATFNQIANEIEAGRF